MSGGLFYTMGLNPAQFIGGMQRAQNAMTGFKGGMGGLLGMATKLVGAFAAIGAGAGVFMAVKKGLQLAADFEKTEVGMDTIIKNLQVTKGLVRQLQALAANTPLELSELLGATRTMLGGGWNIGSIVRDLRMLGDVASGAQTDVGGLVTVINQVKGKGKMMAEEMHQFAERGVAGLHEELAKVKGVQVAQLFKVMEQGNVSVTDLMQAFRNMTSEGGTYFQSMQRQAKTTYGLMSTLRDSINQIYLAFSIPLNDAMKPALEKAIALADMLAARARDVVGAWMIAWGEGNLGKLLWEQFKWALANIANTGVAVVNSLATGMKSVMDVFMKEMNPTGLWTSGVNILKAGLLAAAAAFKEEIAQIFIDLNRGLPQMMKALGIELNEEKLMRMKLGAKRSQRDSGSTIDKEIQNIGATLDKGAPKLIDALTRLPRVMQDAFNQAPDIFPAMRSQFQKDMETRARMLRNESGMKEQEELRKKTNPDKPSALDYLKGTGIGAMKNMMKPGTSPLDYLKEKGIGTGYQRSLTLREREQQANGAGSKVVARVRSRREEEKDDMKAQNGILRKIETNTAKQFKVER
jgi:tape measure domain-containing protein